MSRFSGPQREGASRTARDLRRAQALARATRKETVSPADRLKEVAGRPGEAKRERERLISMLLYDDFPAPANPAARRKRRVKDE